MRRFFAFVAILAAIFIVTGCGGGGNYKPVTATPEYPTIPAKVVVTDFKDQREFSRQAATISKAPPLTWSQKYEFTHPDEVYAGSIDPLPKLAAKSLANALTEGKQFEEVVYAPPEELPARGTYDILITGTVRDARAYGRSYFYSLVLPLGFQFSDILWYLGFPKFTRKYDFAMDVEVINYYDDKALTEPIVVKQTTSSKTFLTYASENRLNDLKTKINGVWNEVVAQMHSKIPTGKDAQYYAGLREQGNLYLAEVALKKKQMEQGSPPTIQFISPIENAIVRGAKTKLNWTAAIPGGLKAIDLDINGTPIAAGVRSSDMLDPATATTSIPAREADIDLKMGENKVTAHIVDHRKNSADAVLTFQRYPQQLSPRARYALLIGAGSLTAAATVQDMKAVLVDPFVGQMADADVITATGTQFDKSAFDKAVADIGRKAKAGELAVIYVAANGKAADMTFGDGIPLKDLVPTLQRSMATENVVLLIDLDWDNSSQQEVLAALGELPLRWAVSVANSTPTPPEKDGNKLLYGKTLADVLRLGSERMTLDLWLSRSADSVEEISGKKMRPEFTGRYDRNFTMAEFQ